MYLKFFFCTFLFSAFSLSAIAQTTSVDHVVRPSVAVLDTVSNRDEAVRQVGKVAVVKGKYAAFTLPNIKGMNRCAKIILSDNSQVLLETGKKIKRKKSEYKKMMSKNVSVTGKMSEKIPLDFKGAPRIVGGLVVRNVKVSLDEGNVPKTNH